MKVTPRQRQILQLLADGLSSKEIAYRLGLRPRTVQTHLERLFREHDVHTRAEAVAHFLRTQNEVGTSS